MGKNCTIFGQPVKVRGLYYRIAGNTQTILPPLVYYYQYYVRPVSHAISQGHKT
jgi:hypothetical protein